MVTLMMAIQGVYAATDARIKRLVYEDNKVFNLQCAPFTATQVVFSEDEVVLERESGDRAVWMVTKPLPNMVFIKPTVLGSNTNITIVTNKHNYYFHAKSDKSFDDNQSSKTYAIQFVYPKEEALKRKQEKEYEEALKRDAIDPIGHPERYNFNYRYSGNKRLIPPHVFDDGRFTYFELGTNPIPAIFAVDNADGKEGVVNVRRSGNYLVVQRLAPQFTLRSGSLVASVFNTTEIVHIRKGNRPL